MTTRMETLAPLGKQTVRDEAEGLSADAVVRDKNMRTSMLFMELQNQVEDALRWRHACDAKNRKVSADIAARCPLLFSDEAAPAQRNTEAPDLTVMVESDFANFCARRYPTQCSFTIEDAIWRTIAWNI